MGWQSFCMGRNPRSVAVHELRINNLVIELDRPIHAYTAESSVVWRR
jgi:hypothetical protein